MLCPFCGKQLGDGTRFCTGCGKALIKDNEQIDKEHLNTETIKKIFPQKQKIPVKEKKTIDQYLEPVIQWIERFGSTKKISGALIPLSAAIMVAVRLLGGLLCALLLTLCNSFLIYLNYKEQKKLPTKLLLWSAIIFIIGWTF